MSDGLLSTAIWGKAVGLGFLAALVLAWPTYGLSILAWLALCGIRGFRRGEKANEREARKVFIEPLFADRFAEFFRALDIPMNLGMRCDNQAAYRCGRLIMGYLAHNPDEGGLFMRGLRKWRTKGTNQLGDPVESAESERKYNAKGEIHLVAYRAIEALMTNNPALPCFQAVDYHRLVTYRIQAEALETLQLAG